MSNTKRQTKVKDKSNGSLIDELNRFASRQIGKETANNQMTDSEISLTNQEDKDYRQDINNAVKTLFQNIGSQEFVPQDFETEVPVDSIEAQVGYSSLIRQMHKAFLKRVAFYRSEEGGCLSVDEARRRAFHPCTDEKEALKLFDEMLGLPLDRLKFVDLLQLQSFSPRTAEWFWEKAKQEGRAEFESGHLAANITFPVGYMQELWNTARYLGVRESFIDEWNPKGGIEVALIDMLAQSYFQWQYWLEQTVKRSETSPRHEHPEYLEWQRNRKELNQESWIDGHWLKPTLKEREAIEHAVLMADRFNRIFMRTLRQLRDLRRYSPLTINNPNQVNIANDGGQQVNFSKLDDDKIKGIAS